jgi:nucleotide-binding universal stress UspA family protein
MKILVATSGNFDDATDPAHSVFNFPWPRNAQIQVLSVAEVIYPLMVGMSPDVADTTDLEVPTDEQARDTAEAAAGHFRKLGFAAEGLYRKGNPEAAILDYAKEWGADLIVVGSHDRSRMERFLLGSVSESVVKHSPCSVLVLKHRACSERSAQAAGGRRHVVGEEAGLFLQTVP